MATRRRKTRRLRASRTHGWGRSGQHRGSGSQGGHGNAGWKRHRWSAVIRYGIQIGEPGFRSVNHNYHNPINLGDMVEKLPSLIEAGYAKQSNGKLDIELGRAGYTKLLSGGEVDTPLRVIVNQCSKKAAEKVTQAGGEIILPNKQKEG